MNLPKLNKDQVQKVVLSTIGFLFLLYVYFTFFLGPLNRSRASAQAAVNNYQHKLDTSKSEIAKTATLEREAKNATVRFAALKALNPEGAPIAWFPPRVKQLFGAEQIEKAGARLDGTTPLKSKDLSAWAKYNWIIDLPQVDYDSLGKSIADLENEEPLLTITKLSVHTISTKPQFQHVSIAASSIITKR
jgi:hypothetical protein